MGHGQSYPEGPPSQAPSMGTSLLRLSAALLVVVCTMASFVATVAAGSCPAHSGTGSCPAGTAPSTGPRLQMPTLPTASPAADPAARPEPKPTRTPKPKPTPKPPAPPPATSPPAPEPGVTTPRPALTTPVPKPQAPAAPIVQPAANAASPAAAASVVAGAGTTSGGRGGGGTSSLDAGGGGGLPGILIPLIAAAAGGCFLIVLAMRRWESEALEAQTAAALPDGIGGVALSAPLPPVPSSTESAESHLPRWLRPSVAAARFELPRDAAPAPQEARDRLAFVDTVDEVTERMVVRYDVVPLLDRPDEAQGRPQEQLDSGDEVVVLEREEVWARVRTPTAREGWIPTMTLTSPDAFVEEPEAAVEAVGVDDGPALDDAPALEALLAMAAARRAQADGTAPPPEEPPPIPEAPVAQIRSRPDRARKMRKAKRRTWSRAARPSATAST